MSKDAVVFDSKLNRPACIWHDNLGRNMTMLKDENGKKHYKRVYRLVAETFIPNPNNLPQVNHIDGIQDNDVFDNLEWVSNSENTKHGYVSGLYHNSHRSHKIKVYTNTGEYIKTYDSIRSMCSDLHVNRKTVTSILKGIKSTNNYNYNFQYADESQSTIESATVGQCGEASRVPQI